MDNPKKFFYVVLIGTFMFLAFSCQTAEMPNQFNCDKAIKAIIRGEETVNFCSEQVDIERRAGPGFTRYTLEGTSADGKYTIRLKFSDEGLTKPHIEIPKNATGRLTVKDESKTKQYTANLTGRVILDQVNAEFVAGGFVFDASLEDKPERQVHVDGNFSFSD